MKQGQLGAGLHQLGGALETGLSEVDVIISISLRYLVDLFNECQSEILLNSFNYRDKTLQVLSEQFDAIGIGMMTIQDDNHNQMF